VQRLIHRGDAGPHRAHLAALCQIRYRVIYVPYRTANGLNVTQWAVWQSRSAALAEGAESADRATKRWPSWPAARAGR